MRRSSTLRMASPFAAATLLPHPRVESVAQAVAKEPEADGDRDKHRSREYEQVGIEPHLIGPSLIKAPREAAGGWMPSPIKLKNASKKTAVGTVYISVMIRM